MVYHDREWGVPLHDDRALFEFLILEGHQAGLSWETVLRKRDAYREAFDGFDPARVAKYDRKKIGKLLTDARLIRNRLKMDSAVTNAQAFLAVQKEFGSFNKFVGNSSAESRARIAGIRCVSAGHHSRIRRHEQRP